ncbi:MAG: outer membrane beta-barrel protein [Dysgonamonadaceae bacterium]|jgi:hypothetical protein|nr:outer membrane beta-barrel protein [Dysgonamonadaceae bacterium]
MKIFGNILIFLFCSLSVFGQKNGALSGTILDRTDNEPIVAGSVELLNAKDSAFVAGVISGVDGSFSFKNLPAGNYILKITYIGYNTLFKNISLRSNQNIGRIYLQTNDILLQEAVIEGKKPEVIVKNDTIEYDAASYKVTENAVIEDLLKKLPGVEVDKEGKITVNGKEVKKFLVDNKDFFSDDPQVASKNLPAEMVDKLQVVDRKSEMARMTGFDDGEEETIINLTIRPGMKKGTMGNALAGAGFDLQNDNEARYQGAAFINNMKENDRYTVIAGTNNNNNMGAADLGANQFGGMRMRRGGGGGIAKSTNFMASINKEFSPELSLNGDVRYSGSDRLSISNVTQVTLFSNPQLDRNQKDNNYFSGNMSANFTLEWKPDSQHTIIFRPNIRYNRSHSYEQGLSDRYNYNDMSSVFNSKSISLNKGQGINLGGSLDYSYKFNKPGRVFSFEINGSYNDSYSQENSYVHNVKYEESLLPEKQDQRLENDENNGNSRITISYVEPLGENKFLQGMYRISYRDTRNINSTYDLLEDLQEYDPALLYSLAADTTAVLAPDLSRSTVRHSTTQRFGLNFKSVHEKYNYTVGFNIDPSRSINETYQPSIHNILYLPYLYDRSLINMVGDSLVNSTSQNVVNFSPVVNFNYLFAQRTNLRINYEGQTNQPTANQLKGFIDKTNPIEWNEGNPSLKPGYQNSLRIRFSKYAAETQLAYNLDLSGNLSFNDITSVTRLLDNGVRLTSYENVNGNWDTRLRGMFNMPLKNKKFTIGGFAMISYRNQNSLVNEMKNTMRNFTVMDNMNINYRSNLFDIGINFSVNHSDITYTIHPEKNQNTFNLGIGGYTTWYLPYNLVIESDVNWTQRQGYYEGFNIPETIWNVAITKQLFNKKFGTGSLKLQIYDILQDRSNISASSTTNGFQTSEVNGIPSYFMCSFIYKFTAFPKQSTATENDLMIHGRRFGGPGGPPPR